MKLIGCEVTAINAGYVPLPMSKHKLDILLFQGLYHFCICFDSGANVFFAATPPSTQDWLLIVQPEPVQCHQSILGTMSSTRDGMIRCDGAPYYFYYELQREAPKTLPPRKRYCPSSHWAIRRLYLGRSSNSPEKRETRIKKKNLPTKKIQAIYFPKSCQIIPA